MDDENVDEEKRDKVGGNMEEIKAVRGTTEINGEEGERERQDRQKEGERGL